MRKSKQLEFHFVEDYYPERRTYHSAVSTLETCNFEAFMLLRQLEKLCCDRQCDEIKQSTKFFPKLGTTEQWKPIYDTINKLTELNRKSNGIHWFLLDHYYDVKEALLKECLAKYES